jgi:hypothetical protein
VTYYMGYTFLLCISKRLLFRQGSESRAKLPAN